MTIDVRELRNYSDLLQEIQPRLIQSVEEAKNVSTRTDSLTDVGASADRGAEGSGAGGPVEDVPTRS
jgi:hypothetical protein